MGVCLHLPKVRLRRACAALVAMGLAVAGLAGCGGGSAPESNYYRLTAEDVGTRAGGPLPGAAEIAPFRADGMVNGRAILFGNNPSVIKAYSYHSWWQAPGVMLQESLIDALRRANAFDQVAAPEMKVDRVYDVLGRIRRLEQNGDHVVVEMELTLRLARGGPPLLLKTYHEEVPGAGVSVPATVEAFSVAIGRIWASFVTDLDTIVPPKTK